ncbi:hypothetical protein [Orbus mooreae]|uniref:hypothetical protein n=1 Tax=Orbus mooreae TaxID=3074107 RepID=UPI00370D0A27
MSEKKETLSFDDKEKIKEAVLMSIAKQDLNAEQLAEQACKAIDYINSYPNNQS